MCKDGWLLYVGLCIPALDIEANMLVVLQVLFCSKSAATIIGGLDVGQVQAPHQMQRADRPIH